MTEPRDDALLARITSDPEVFGGKPVVRGRRLAVEHVLSMLAAGDSVEDLLREYQWLERDDVRACLLYARRLVGRTSGLNLPFRVGESEGPHRQLCRRVCLGRAACPRLTTSNA
jgi:uncharacterized protein (DUF433 family)